MTDEIEDEGKVELSDVSEMKINEKLADIFGNHKLEKSDIKSDNKDQINELKK